MYDYILSVSDEKREKPSVFGMINMIICFCTDVIMKIKNKNKKKNFLLVLLVSYVRNKNTIPEFGRVSHFCGLT